MTTTRNRLLFVHYGGDLRAAYHLLTKTGQQEYFSHRYIFKSVTGLSQTFGESILLCCKTDTRYDEMLEPGLRAIGAGLDPYLRTKEILDIIAKQNPTHIIIHSPIRQIFQWAVSHNIRTIGLLADSFTSRGIRQKIRHARLANILNQSGVDWIGNHGLKACQSLQSIGVKPSKIIPWDFPYKLTPADFTPKTLDISSSHKQLLYVGRVSVNKGVDDILQALAHLNRKGLKPLLKVAGRGELNNFQVRAQQFGLTDQVEFLGPVVHSQVMMLMQHADAMIVPSHPEYPEGFPLTIYEGLTTRTPLIVSNHPMFCGNLRPDREVLMFRAKNSIELARCIDRVLTNTELYNRLSNNSHTAWQRLQLPVKWDKFVFSWLRDTSKDYQWLTRHSLAGGSYPVEKLYG